MVEFRVIAVAERSPTRCAACGNHVGPFVDVQTTVYQLGTAHGAMDIDGGIYICVGNEERPGCIIQMARATGLMVDSYLYREQVERGNRFAIMEQERSAELEAALSDKVVSLADVLGGIQAGQIKTATKVSTKRS